MSSPRLELIEVTKQFGEKKANDAISMAVHAGSIHAVVGENGAGKSTLMSIIYGLLQPDEGQILWDSKECVINNPLDARKLGVGIVMQHFSLFESMTVLENLYLHASIARKLSLKELEDEARDAASEFGFQLDLHARVENLSVGEQQRVEILRCLLQEDLKLLILDEPTTVLTPDEIDALLSSLKALAKSGCSVLFISHKLREIRAIADTASILRGGRVIGRITPSDIEEQGIAAMMMGGDTSLAAGASDSTPKSAFHAAAKQAKSADPSLGAVRLDSAPLIKLKNISGGNRFGDRPAVHQVSLSVEAGEILGVAGIAGNGQDALLDLVSGEQKIISGEVILFDEHVSDLGLAKRYRLGLSSVAAERRDRSVSINQSLLENTYLKSRLRQEKSFIDWAQVKSLTQKIIRDFNVVCSGENDIAANLSGGNLQKFVMGRELLSEPKFFICHQPTWGVDIHAATFIRQRLRDLARSGAAVIVISEDLDELTALCSSLAVICDGRLSEQRPIDDWELSEIGRYMTGLFANGNDNDMKSVRNQRSVVV